MKKSTEKTIKDFKISSAKILTKGKKSKIKGGTVSEDIIII